jgi:NAD(P)-dependent dehydrogenase (short-subunit alcohol dehydrogenase family)
MIILITGGASGLGEAITKTLANNENNMVYFTFSSSVSAAEKLEKEFKNVKGISCNFEEESALKSLLENLNQIDLDVVIHNAYSGEFLKSHFHKINSYDFLTDFKNNLMPIIEITQIGIANFRKKKSGKIITILTSALQGTPPIGSAVYTANKAYLEKLTQVWANENAKFNITSNSVSPAFMETSMTSSIDERVKEQIIENNPLKRLLTTDEVAKAVQFLVNDVTQINGKDFVINAGSTLK